MIDQNVTDARTLRLVWPQWQGAGRDTVAELLPEVPIDRARRSYALGTRVLQAILPDHPGPTEVVPVDGGNPDEGSTGGVESRSAILASLAAAQRALARHDFDRVLTLGGECSVSVAPFAELAHKYEDDLAVIWIDSHPDTDTPDTGYDGFHAMAVSALTGHGDGEILNRLPAHVDSSRLALVGLHDWVPDAYAHVDQWGLRAFTPTDLRKTSSGLLDWLASTGAGKVAVHLDVDTVDSAEAVLGLGQVPDGLNRAQIRRVIGDIAEVADIVGLTIAEFIPRDVLAIEELIDGLPLTR
ncbi:arginase family protein [Brevibacterium sp. 91QC2O2]|uniref:arginase family protein n=1 Tax=Brevibacterium sp. 91QC2O2 TaxID=2968458 RepID=UPI00211C60A9|nr:arginase family protein [Brevibacterium sp. 91QC2O2]MCQ9368361.1 arginase family protein [Brevibacterium sp. 91QC2O2]